MNDEDDLKQRKSIALTPELIEDPEIKAIREAENGVRQFDETLKAALTWIENPDRRFRLRPSIILGLQRTALNGLDCYAGNFRPGAVRIGGSLHEPVEAFRVPLEVEDLCDYINDNWDKTAIHLASYVLWRLNWIHPFTDGNGRTSRAVSYLVLMVRLGYLLPGVNTIPEQIAANKKPYYEALEAADSAWRERREVDVQAMEKLIEGLLARQLVSVMNHATGIDHSSGG
ncbi:MAG TPA: Fic family protein [Azospirillaceae bacterium]|nr:Fic family protein [Azospirillaceae bacterium]HRQ82410.1 Fic family protein [Azospirillaceae bacterium]